jgi:hypothetical protein
MNINHRAIVVFIFLGIVLSSAPSLGQGNHKNKAEVGELRQRLASLNAGMSSDEVLKLIGKPDEVRRVPDDHLLDGTRYVGDKLGIGPETERWAFGVTGKGMFARIGIVSMDRNGKLVAALPTDEFARPGRKLPDQAPVTGDQAVVTPANLSCHAGAIKYHPKRGESAESFETKVTLKNAGTKRFELKHDAASTLRRFLLVEIHDSTGMLLFRLDEMRYHSLRSFDPADWPVLAVDPGKEISETLFSSPSRPFGPLPLGKYSLRVYFPFEKGRYYPSNAVNFEVKEEDRIKGQK